MHEQGSVHVRFCSVDNCTALLQAFTTQGTRCMLYDYDRALNLTGQLYVYEKNARGQTAVPSEGRMHNKFCVRDRWTMTGSLNPTQTGVDHYNNVVFLNSSSLTANYRRELGELVRGEEGQTEITSFNISGTSVEQYFCPEDACEERVVEELRRADDRIVFMQFMLTSDPITKILEEKAQEIQVEGVMEAFGLNPYSAFHALNSSKADVRIFNKDPLLHHKVFVIDNRTVITGSYNPTRAATTRNDENILIIRDKNVASSFIREYERVTELL